MFFCGVVTNANKIIPLSRQTSVEAEMKNANKAPVSETFVMIQARRFCHFQN